MKNTVLSLIAVPVFIISISSCDNTNKENQTSKEGFPEKNWTTSDLAGKYSFEEDGDTIILDLKNQNDSLVGALSYSFQEKDKNNGLFKGVIKDSLLIGEYAFMSEGINSVRETVFGIVPGGLIEGFGEIVEEDSVMVFKNIDSLRFDHGMILHKK